MSQRVACKTALFAGGWWFLALQPFILQYFCDAGRDDVHSQHPQPVCHQHRQVTSQLIILTDLPVVRNVQLHQTQMYVLSVLKLQGVSLGNRAG